MNTISRLVLMSSLIFTLSFCGKEPPAPLPFEDEKIVEILVDVHFAEAAMQSLGRVVKDSMKQVYFDQIAQIHQVDRNQIDTLLFQLRNRPLDMKRLYESMMEKIEVQEKEINTKPDPQRPPEDSTDIIQLKEAELKG